MATYGPGIDQSQHAKSVSHIIIRNTFRHDFFTILKFRVLEFRISLFTKSQNI